MSQDQDRQILFKISEGDSKSFEQLLDKYQNLIYGYCMRMLKDKQKSEDITQETWMRVVKNASSYSPTGSVKSWIMMMARNLVIDEFRVSKKWKDIGDEEWSQFEDSQDSLEEMFLKNQRSEKLSQAFGDLPESQKVILTMVLVEELSQSEVSQKLNISVGAVKASLFRAREALKKKMEGQ